MATVEHLAELLKGVEAWNKWREENEGIIPDLEGVKLVGVNLPKVNLSKANLKRAGFCGITVNEPALRAVDSLPDVCTPAILTEADLGQANLQEANLSNANLKGAIFHNANLEGANLNWAKLQRANLSAANFKNTKVVSVRANRKTKFRAIRLEGCYGSPRFERFAKDQDYLEELQESGCWGKFIYWVWYFFADCGRSLLLWGFWSIVLAGLFGYGFWKMGPEAFRVKDLVADDLWTYIYYSVVTFTTLGFGDITPATKMASFLVMLEVITGYIMLGGLVSILANKLARRS